MGHHRAQTSGNKTATISASRAGLATPPSAGVRPARVPKQPRGNICSFNRGLSSLTRQIAKFGRCLVGSNVECSDEHKHRDLSDAYENKRPSSQTATLSYLLDQPKMRVNKHERLIQLPEFAVHFFSSQLRPGHHGRQKYNPSERDSKHHQQTAERRRCLCRMPLALCLKRPIPAAPRIRLSSHIPPGL